MTKCPHCDCDTDPIKGLPRSVDQLKRFFGVLRAMFHHWPEDTEFQPHNVKHLRAWVICKAGHGRIIATEQLPPVADLDARAEMKAIIARAYSMDLMKFPRWKGNTLAVYEPKSIAFKSMGQAAFNKLNDEVEAVYKAETGLDPDQLLKEKAA